jgi:hypothetical protein
MHVAVAGPAVGVGVGDGDGVGDGGGLEVGDGNGVGMGDPWLAVFPERHAPDASTTATARILGRDAFIDRL